MKRWLISASIIFLVALTALIPLRQAYQLSINSSYYNVYQNLASAKGWGKWYPGVNDSDRSVVTNKTGGFRIEDGLLTVALKQTGLGAFDVEITNSSGVNKYTCFVTASDTMGITKVNVSRKANVFKYIWWLIRDTRKETFAYKLKNYLEDTQRYYGFVISKQVAKEQLMMVLRQKSVNNNICLNNRTALKYLLDFSSTMKLKITGPVQLQYISSMKDSTEIMVGLPVVKKQKKGAGVEYMDTHGGKVLIGYFKGKYKDRQKLYTAMSLYLADHYLHDQTKPIEKFKDNQLPYSDESAVDLQLVIPYA